MPSAKWIVCSQWKPDGTAYFSYFNGANAIWSPTLNCTAAGNFTIEGQFYFTGTSQNTIFAIGNESSGRIVFYHDGSTNALGYNIYGSGNVSLTATTVATATASSTASSVGYLGVPQNSQSSTYTLVIGDIGRHVYMTGGGNVVIPDNANVAFPVGTTINIVTGASAINVVTQSLDSLYQGGTGSTGTRSLNSYGMATLMKVATQTWYVAGAGVS